MLISGISIATNKNIPSRPHRITVYLQGAQIHHSEDLTIPLGTTEFSFQGVSPYMDQNTVVSSGKGDFTILETRFNTRYPEAIVEKDSNPLQQKYERQIRLKNDSIQELNYSLKLLEARKKNLVVEKNFLENNRLIKGETKRDTLALVINALEYYRSRMGNIDAEWIKATREEDKLNRQKAEMQESVNELSNLIAKIRSGEPVEDAQPIYEVVITVSADVAQAGSIDFNYYTPQASWIPEYDLKAKTISTGIQLVQKAKVYQNTLTDWKNVQMTLSTGNPRLSNSRPFLSPFYAGYYRPYATQEVLVNTNVAGMAMMEMIDDAEYDAKKSAPKMQAEAKMPANYTTVVNTPVLVEYKIDASYSIPSDNKPHVVVIQKKELDTKFEYYAIPKLDADAFLQAKLINWEELNLLQGEAKIYFDGSFVGKSSINPSITSDTLALDLGRDKSINIERKKLKDKCKEQLLGENKIITRSYSITLRNNKSIAAKVNVQDQIPLSAQKDIVIENENLDGADKDELTGIITWAMNLKPKESRTVKFSYTVKYQKGVVLNELP